MPKPNIVSPIPPIGTLVWVAPAEGTSLGMTHDAMLHKHGNLWVVESYVYARDANKRLTTTHTGWVWCKSLATGMTYDWYVDNITTHNEEGVTEYVT